MRFVPAQRIAMLAVYNLLEYEMPAGIARKIGHADERLEVGEVAVEVAANQDFGCGRYDNVPSAPAGCGSYRFCRAVQSLQS